MKVKIFLSGTVAMMEYLLNDFIEDKKVIDIKYCVNKTDCSALVIYEEKR